MRIKRRNRDRATAHSDPWWRVRIAMAILVGVVVGGVVGYRLLGLSLFDAFYQTTITVTTVGFSETGPASEIDTSYRAFTMVLAFIGVSGALYTLGVTVEALVEGSINDGFRFRKEHRMIEHMSDHLIVAGAGRVGRSIIHYVSRHGADVVLIDRLPQPDEQCPMVVGEATEDEVLKLAGIERARTLIAALNSDADNVYVTLSARALNPDLHIVARTHDQANEQKFFQAGANRVVNPHEIGGSRMGALALHPTLAEFLDEVLHDESHGVRVDEITIEADSAGVGRTVGEVIGPRGLPLVIALRDQDHGYVPTPAPTAVLRAGSVLVVIGSDAVVDALRRDVT